MHPRIAMFLHERDRARLRGDGGVYRSTTADLRRLGVPDEATLANPSGIAEPAKRRGPKARCEHGRTPERCEDCAQAELDESRTA